MKTINKDFDCLEMKNSIQTKIYNETKNMNYSELRGYLDSSLQSNFWKRIN